MRHCPDPQCHVVGTPEEIDDHFETDHLIPATPAEQLLEVRNILTEVLHHVDTTGDVAYLATEAAKTIERLRTLVADTGEA